MCWLISERLIVLACMLCSCQCVRVFVSQKQKLEAVLEEREDELEALPAWVVSEAAAELWAHDVQPPPTLQLSREAAAQVVRLRTWADAEVAKRRRSTPSGATHAASTPAACLSQGFVRHAFKSRHSSDHTCDHQSCSLPAARVALSPIPPRMKLLCRRVVQCLKRPCVSVWS